MYRQKSRSFSPCYFCIFAVISQQISPCLCSEVLAIDQIGAIKENAQIVARSNADLKSMRAVTTDIVYRQGFVSPGDSPDVRYKSSKSPCSLNRGQGDNGSQVRSADNGCWIAVIDSEADVRIWGARAGENIDDELDAAVAWACQNHKPITLPYNSDAPYKLKRQHTFGNGSSASLSTCNTISFEVRNSQLAPSSGTKPPMPMAFEYNGPPGVIPFVAQGPAQTISLKGITVNCKNICSTAFRISTIMNGRYDRLGAQYWTNGPAIILTAEHDNPWVAGLEGSHFSNIALTIPGPGGSGIQIGDTKCTKCNRSVIANLFENFSINWDSTNSSAYGIEIGRASQLTLINMRVAFDPVRGGKIGTPLKISPPPGSIHVPADITFIHPLFTGVVDPGPSAANWNPSTGGIHFISWSSVYSPFPSSAVPGRYFGTDSRGSSYYISPAQKRLGDP